MIDTHDFAYIAGVIDTWGILRIRYAGKTRLPEVRLQGAQLATMQWLAEITNTKAVVVDRSYDRGACATHCKIPHIHIEATTKRWNITGARATIMLMAIQPYIRLRTEQVAELIGVGRSAGWKDHTTADMKRLGWPVPESYPVVRMPERDDHGRFATTS